MIDLDKDFLLNVFPKYKDANLHQDKTALNMYYQAEKILKGLPTIQSRGCKCEYNSFKTSVDKLYEEWLLNGK
jgi:hypothetical protein